MTWFVMHLIMRKACCLHRCINCSPQDKDWTLGMFSRLDFSFVVCKFVMQTKKKKKDKRSSLFPWPFFSFIIVSVFRECDSERPTKKDSQAISSRETAFLTAARFSVQNEGKEQDQDGKSESIDLRFWYENKTKNEKKEMKDSSSVLDSCIALFCLGCACLPHLCLQENPSSLEEKTVHWWWRRRGKEGQSRERMRRGRDEKRNGIYSLPFIQWKDRGIR